MEAHLQLYEIMLAATKPMALQAAVVLNIPDIIAIYGNENLLSVEEIASYISAHSRKSAQTDYLARIMRFLACIGVFTEETTVVNGASSQFKYGLTSVSRLLIKKDNYHSLSPVLFVLNNKIVLDAYQHLHESVIEGCYAFNKAHGMDLWDYGHKYPDANRVLNEGLANHTQDILPSLVKIYDGFKSVKTLVDVGGGIGSSLSTIIKEYPHIHGINFDLPHVIKTAPPIHGVEHMGGNMFDQIPCADGLFMKCILHDWNDEQCVKLLKKSYEAIPENGKLLIVEIIVEENEEATRQLGLMHDVLMMGYTSGGRERTEEEFKTLFEKSGFKSYTIIRLPSLYALIEVFNH
ncbi:hypothetical protein SUGI_0344110 [Cryptomeria japonica]|uniref:caffeic acid 3-O-methyltransferase n=1 Tax=Cryptomeria japonica TaxID=3369 RepID=UPI002408E0FD|nr:caffeic acid 3-O-methyltransferase [Cryptomeria japonica]GLJ19159.1 hypothetical protein SUGI_0344110 [Cryptomeria japonica]